MDAKAPTRQLSYLDRQSFARVVLASGTARFYLNLVQLARIDRWTIVSVRPLLHLGLSEAE